SLSEPRRVAAERASRELNASRRPPLFGLASRGYAVPMFPLARSRHLIGVGLLAVASLSCGGERTAVDETDPWTVGTIEVPLADGARPSALPVLTALEPVSLGTYDRTTLSFEGATVLPGYRAAYVDRPLHECGSGRQVFP